VLKQKLVQFLASQAVAVAVFLMLQTKPKEQQTVLQVVGQLKPMEMFKVCQLIRYTAIKAAQVVNLAVGLHQVAVVVAVRHLLAETQAARQAAAAETELT
jgi:hypothetical protein